MNTKFIIALIFVLTLFVGVRVVSAHVVVKPAEVNIGKYQTFTMGVPVEKDVATIGVRLVVPEGLEHVTPNVKPGWKISTKTTGEGEAKKVTEISWTGGTIPAGQRDDFMFSAKVPASEQKLAWKAYQTYANGVIVAWDRDPAETITDFSSIGPYSVTTVVNDMAATSTAPKTNSQNTAFVFSILALVFSVIALGKTRSVNN